jgi:hypothetical protein
MHSVLLLQPAQHRLAPFRLVFISDSGAGVLPGALNAVSQAIPAFFAAAFACTVDDREHAAFARMLLSAHS